MKSLFERARNYRHGVLETRLVARADDLNRPLTDEEVYEELKYQLDDLSYKPDDDAKWRRDFRAACLQGIAAYERESEV